MKNQIHLTKTQYSNWQNCYKYTNAMVELVLLTDVGPRIIDLRYSDGENLFAVFPETLGLTGGDTWRIYGGHRFWHAPEEKPRTYYPDNNPVALEQHEGFVRLVQPTEPSTRIQKEIDIWLDQTEPHIQVCHRLRNHNPWAVSLAPWAVSVMAPGGTAVVPLPPRGSHDENLLPTNTITLWAYTNMADPRWTWGSRFVLLRQDAQISDPQKAGFAVSDGWVAYAWKNYLFIKSFTHLPGRDYPDMGCSVETFTNQGMLEVETLGPLVQLPPGKTVEHIEDWWLFKDFENPGTPEELYESVSSFVKKIH